MTDAEPGLPAGGGPGPEGPPSFPGNAPPPPRSVPAAGPPAFPAGARTPGGHQPSGTGAAMRGAPYASWGIRVGGYLIDAVILLVVFALFFVLFRHSHTLDVHLMAPARGPAAEPLEPAVPDLRRALRPVRHPALRLAPGPDGGDDGSGGAGRP